MTPNRGRAPTACKCPPDRLEPCACPSPTVRIKFRNGVISKEIRPANWWKRWTLNGDDHDIVEFEIVS